jgi:ATP-dependent DNA helicase RecG
MWANTSPNGGLVFVGIENNGSVSGCEHCTAEHINAIEDGPRIYCPDARVESKRVGVINHKGKEDYIIAFRVQWRPDKVVKNNCGGAFVRSGDKKKTLSADEVRELQIAKGEVHHELEQISMQYPDDFNKSLLREFVKNVQKAKGLEHVVSISDVLRQQRLGTMLSGRFSPYNAACLLFASDPMTYFPGCKIRVMRFDGEQERTGDEYALIKDITIEGPIPILIFETEKAVRSQLREYSALGEDGRFYSVPEYPQTAWYEAIVNACVHRSYNLKTMHIFVKIFDDRIEVVSPGGFPPMVTPDNIYRTHNPRNPFLMEALRFFGFVKCANEGTRRMFEAMKQSNLPPPKFAETQSNSSANVAVVLYNNYKQRRRFIDSCAVGAVVTAAVLQTLSEEEKRIINYVVEFGSITVTQAAKTLDREWGTAKSRLQRLVQMSILAWKGKKEMKRDPNSKYVLITPLTKKP